MKFLAWYLKLHNQDWDCRDCSRTQISCPFQKDMSVKANTVLKPLLWWCHVSWAFPYTASAQSYQHIHPAIQLHPLIHSQQQVPSFGLRDFSVILFFIILCDIQHRTRFPLTCINILAFLMGQCGLCLKSELDLYMSFGRNIFFKALIHGHVTALV